MKRSTKAARRKVWRTIVTSYFILASAWTVHVAIAAINELFGRPLGYYDLSP